MNNEDTAQAFTVIKMLYNGHHANAIEEMKQLHEKFPYAGWDDAIYETMMKLEGNEPEPEEPVDEFEEEPLPF